jgi:hypothetical protein
MGLICGQGGSRHFALEFGFVEDLVEDVGGDVGGFGGDDFSVDHHKIQAREEMMGDFRGFGPDHFGHGREFLLVLRRGRSLLFAVWEEVLI